MFGVDNLVEWFLNLLSDHHEPDFDAELEEEQLDEDEEDEEDEEEEFE